MNIASNVALVSVDPVGQYKEHAHETYLFGSSLGLGKRFKEGSIWPG